MGQHPKKTPQNTMSHRCGPEAWKACCKASKMAERSISIQRGWKEHSLSGLVIQTRWDLFGHRLLRAMEYQCLHTHFYTHACTQGLVHFNDSTTWMQEKKSHLPFLAKVHVCDARTNTDTHMWADSLWGLSLTLCISAQRVIVDPREWSSLLESFHSYWQIVEPRGHT